MEHGINKTLCRAICATVLLGLLLTSSGCRRPRANYDLVDLVDGHGVVSLDGQPLANAVVTFEDAADDTMSYALTDADGKYRLQFDSDMAGVKVGKKVVRISTTRKLLGLNARPGQEGTEDDSDGKAEELVPARYNSQSELTVDVTEDVEQYDFELQSMPKMTGMPE